MPQKSAEPSWTVTYGDRTIHVHAYDLAEAMQTALSLIEKELAFNQVVRANDQLKKKYKIDQLMIEELKARFMKMAVAEEKREIAMKIPGGKR